MSSTRTRLLVRAGSALALVGLLAACATSDPTDLATDLPTGRFPLATTTAPAGIRLAPHDYGLSPTQMEALRDLVADWRYNGEGLILIEAPTCACDDGAMTAYDAREAMMAYGAPSESIRMVGYEAEPGGPIRVSFKKVSAKVYDCGGPWPDLTRSGQNLPRSNLGCAINSNLAAMIENPGDINQPRASDPYDAGRRQVVIERYRAGEITSSEKDSDADASISDAIR